MVVDNTVRQRVQLLRIPAKHTGPKHVVIIFAVIETNQTILCQLLNIRRARIDQPIHRLVLTGKFPVDQKEIRKHLTVEKYDGCFLTVINLRFNILS